MPDFSLLALKLALQAREAEPPPPIDISPIIEKLDEMTLALGIISRAPRHVAAP